ncbi:cofactor-independent phosphoglycerate mutase [Desulfolutivibrio sulfoxidireducens]|uniref:cofactor-independent phosphoglycerate mutase n=1 Tax=Desulfolutivibrio sulfoxidireducens TaxID=2773299 RepID=UPI00159E784F|nr:cofactor-independent phosphoglycerate mutase [Desulfolutivibrio sulfoxidireducens]QLA16043.1 cofactor-independent phosphoglycerate mutase [Desulfolutivibrio sulfoxidireducens]
MKFVFVLADGMGDWPLAALGGKTPLAAAATPHMDELAKAGVVGLCRSIPPGMPPGSDVANMALLGFDPATYHTGRGPIEAAAMGLVTWPDDLIFRLNLVTVSEFSDAGVMRDYSAGHIDTAAARDIVAGLSRTCAGIDMAVYPGVQYRHILVLKAGAGKPGAPSFEAGMAVRPPHDITDQGIAPDLALFRQSPILWDFMTKAQAYLAAANHGTKANAVWPWGQGGTLTLPPFEEKYGMRGAVVSAVDLVKGLGLAAGMEVLDVPGATGLLDTNYAGKVEAALDFLSRGDFVFVHVEAPDECGHGGQVAEKVEAVARIDRLVLGPLRQALAGTDTVFLVACDHFTPITVKTHTTDPVPFVLWRQGIEPVAAPAFTEAAAASTGLVVEHGHELVDFALSRAGGRI